MNDLLNHLPCGIASLAADSEILRVNDTLLDMLGMERGAVEGQPFHNLLSKGGRIFYQTHLFPLLRMRGEVEEIYLSMLASGGDEMPMLMNARTRVAEDGGTVHEVVLVRVRQRAQFETALLNERKKVQQASKAKDEFLAALSHELRTPLNPMLMLSTEMELDQTLPLPVRLQAGIIRSNAELEARLIDDLLDLTRIAHGKLNLVPSIVSLHDLLKLTEDIARSDSRSKAVALRFSKEAAEHHVRCDTARMQQVFWNLVKNAIKFTPAEGTVQVRTYNPKPGRIAVSVTDTGMGIEAEALPHIFAAFEQGSISKQQFGGLGLGLAITKSIVALHQGTIDAESPGLGKGATFTVEFNTCPPSAPQAVARPTTQGSRSLRLLLVEDHDSTREVLSRILRRSGHEVHTARTGAEALILGQTVEGLDAVISDIGLPDKSGLDIMRQLRALQPDLPGIALSGYGMEKDLKEARAAGFAAHLVKPVALDQLRAFLEQVAEGSLR
ncbi:MAG: response regulator [Verrucomicrobia bacterium]|nr:response regulator [Verrucomicrobiota bacterium]